MIPTLLFMTENDNLIDEKQIYLFVFFKVEDNFKSDSTIEEKDSLQIIVKDEDVDGLFDECCDRNILKDDSEKFLGSLSRNSDFV